MSDQSTNPSEADNGFVNAYILSADGEGTPVGWSEIGLWTPEQGTLWVHLDRNDGHVHKWIEERSGLPALAGEILLAEESRPRGVPFRDGIVVTLRGVNLNPGSDVEDMISLRMWVEKNRVITMRSRRLMAVQDLRASLDDGRGPRSSGDVLVGIANTLVDRMVPVVEDMDDGVDSLEDAMLDTENREIRTQIRDVRRKAIGLRRYLAPQRDALARLAQEGQPWLENHQKLRLRETADRVQRIVEELDEMRERAAIIQDEMMSRISEQMNKTMYVLTVVASILLPLGFITGLLGINVGGIPGAESKSGFVWVIGIIVAIGVLQVWLFKRLKWL